MARLGQPFCCGVRNAALAMTEAANGDPLAARRALKEAVRETLILARDPNAFWVSFGVSDRVIDRLNAGLAKAGLAVQAVVPSALAPPLEHPGGRQLGLDPNVAVAALKVVATALARQHVVAVETEDRVGSIRLR